MAMGSCDPSLGHADVFIFNSDGYNVELFRVFRHLAPQDSFDIHACRSADHVASQVLGESLTSRHSTTLEHKVMRTPVLKSVGVFVQKSNDKVFSTIC